MCVMMLGRRSRSTRYCGGVLVLDDQRDVWLPGQSSRMFLGGGNSCVTERERLAANSDYLGRDIDAIVAVHNMLAIMLSANTINNVAEVREPI